MYDLERHFREDQLEAFALGRLQGEELAEVEEHLLLCEQCRGCVEALDELITLRREGSTSRAATANRRSRAAGSGALNFRHSED
jgi:predicted anti-sigma-YlaC factor YlaD